MNFGQNKSSRDGLGLKFQVGDPPRLPRLSQSSGGFGYVGIQGILGALGILGISYFPGYLGYLGLDELGGSNKFFVGIPGSWYLRAVSI